MFERNFNIQGVGMAVFLETFQAYDIDMLKTFQKPILSLVCFFWEADYIKHQQEQAHWEYLS